jgi:hypothetical protein
MKVYWGIVEMVTFVYRCPATGYNVQGLVADDPTEGDESLIQQPEK